MNTMRGSCYFLFVEKIHRVACLVAQKKTNLNSELTAHFAAMLNVFTMLMINHRLMPRKSAHAAEMKIRGKLFQPTYLPTTVMQRITGTRTHVSSLSITAFGGKKKNTARARSATRRKDR